MSNRDAINDRLRDVGDAINALYRETREVMGETSDEAKECASLHAGARDHAARMAGHALLKIKRER